MSPRSRRHRPHGLKRSWRLAPAEIGENDLLQAHVVAPPVGFDWLHRASDEQHGLAIYRARLDDMARRHRHLLVSRPGEQLMRGEDLVDRPVEPDAALGEDHDVVTYALELGDDVRGEDDRQPGL